MAQRKKGKEFQDVFTSYEPWESALVASKRNKSLLIVDVHSTWCGPCTAVVEHFKKIFLEKGEDYPIQFITLDSELVLKSCEEASADEHGIRDQYVEVLKPIAGKSQPHFLFFLSGVLRKMIVGVNTPIIQKCVDRLFSDIDEGKNTGEEGILDFDDEDEGFKQTPRNEEKEEVSELNLAGVSNSDDKEFFDTMTTEEVPPDSARSTASQSGVSFNKLKAYITADGVRAYVAEGAVDDQFAPVAEDDPCFSLGFVAPASQSEQFNRVLYSFFNSETKNTVLVTSPEDIQKYNEATEWTNPILVGLLYESERSQTAPLHALSSDKGHVYTIDSEKVAELVASGYTDEGILGFVSQVEIIPQTPAPSRPVSAKSTIDLKTPRDDLSEHSGNVEEEKEVKSPAVEPTEASEATVASEESATSETQEAEGPAEVEQAEVEQAEPAQEETQSEPATEKTTADDVNDEVAETAVEEADDEAQKTETPSEDSSPKVYRIVNKSNNLAVEVMFEGEAKDLPSSMKSQLTIMPATDKWQQRFLYDGTHITNEASGLRIHHNNHENKSFACMISPTEEPHQVWTHENGCFICKLDGRGLTISAAGEGSKVDIRSFKVESPPADCVWELVQI